MTDLRARAAEPFRFYTRLTLPELTGLRAYSLPELAAILMKAPDACIYHHTHRFLQQHQCLSPEPPNDFAYWIAHVLGEKELSERLASIDTVQFSALAELRTSLAAVIETYLEQNPGAAQRVASRADAFSFIKSVSFVLPTPYSAYDLRGFADALEKVAVDSLYFHVFEARLRLGKATNDFSNWIQGQLGDDRLAADIARLDPYTYTLEELRSRVMRLVAGRIGKAS